MRLPLNVFGAWKRAVDGGEGGEAVEAAERTMMGHLHSRFRVVRVVPAPIMHMMRDDPGFQQMMDQILLPGEGYRPDFDGTQFDGSQAHSDLNEPVSTPLQSFMALGGTPPSAHMPDSS
ncbi:hypothetical protein PIB30_097607 [Stylosanthes scabra]|uniref:VQ domain-containing protein n=1 Tax=Stylosanthes scabra TaxID=79078 RepID=A0ABU6SWW2_9FABA|nr:hypothetical protein [Stylosanthes scabra]